MTQKEVKQVAVRAKLAGLRVKCVGNPNVRIAVMCHNKITSLVTNTAGGLYFFTCTSHKYLLLKEDHLRETKRSELGEFDLWTFGDKESGVYTPGEEL